MSDEEPAVSADVRRAIYDQDGNFYRYRDGLKWARFQTASVIEGGLLYALYQVKGLNSLDRVGVLIVATLLVTIIGVLVLMDDRDTSAHLKRMKTYEANLPFQGTRLAGLGARLTLAAVAVILLLNVALFFRIWF